MFIKKKKINSEKHLMVLFPGWIFRLFDQYRMPECSGKLESLHYFSSGKQALQMFTLLHVQIKKPRGGDVEVLSPWCSSFIAQHAFMKKTSRAPSRSVWSKCVLLLSPAPRPLRAHLPVSDHNHVWQKAKERTSRFFITAQPRSAPLRFMEACGEILIGAQV